MRVPLHHLQFRPNIPAGCNILVVAYFAHRMRTTPAGTDHPDFRVTVTPSSGGYTVTDGRHRVLAAWIAGRSDIACELEA